MQIALENRSYTSTKNSKLFIKNRNSTEYEKKSILYNKIGKTSPNPYFFSRIRTSQSHTKHGSKYDKTRYEYKNIKKMNINQNILLVRKNLIRVRKTINKFNLKWKILQRRSSLSKFLPHREIKNLRQFFFAQGGV